MAKIYDVEGELEKLGYDFEALLEELGGYGGWTAEEILSECERHDIDLEEYKLEEDEE